MARRHIRLGILCVGAVAAVAAWGLFGRAPAASADTDGDGRSQTANWIVEPGAHGAFSALRIECGSAGDVDHGMRVRVNTSAGAFEHDSTVMTHDILAPWDVTTVELNVAQHPTGTVFVITTDYLDAAQQVVDTEVIQFVKP